MIGWVRNIIVIFLVLSIIYAVLSFTSRRKQQAKLEDDYKAEHPTAPKDEFVAKGMQKYNRSLKPKLIFGVFLVPLAVMAVLIYLAQYS